MAVIKSGSGSEQLEVDPVSLAARVTLYDTAGNEITSLSVVPSSGRTLVGHYSASSFRTAGLASAPHNLLTIWNPAASGRRLVIRRLTVQLDHTTLLATNLHIINSRPTAEPTGGTVITATKNDPDYAAAVAVVRGATASDGGGATAITATAGTRIWSQFGQRPHTLVGWFTTDDLNMLPRHTEGGDPAFVVDEGEGLLVNTLSNATTGAHILVQTAWEEYTP